MSNDGGRSPRWSPNGREIFFTVGATPGSLTLAHVAVQTAAPTFAAATPQVLLHTVLGPIATGVRPFDVSRDGRRFLVQSYGEQVLATSASGVEAPHVVLVQHWFEDLKRRAPAR